MVSVKGYFNLTFCNTGTNKALFSQSVHHHSQNQAVTAKSCNCLFLFVNIVSKAQSEKLGVRYKSGGAGYSVYRKLESPD